MSNSLDKALARTSSGLILDNPINGYSSQSQTPYRIKLNLRISMSQFSKHRKRKKRAVLIVDFLNSI